MLISGIVCDRCGKTDYIPHESARKTQEWARDKGYTIGFKCLCPVCQMSIKAREEAEKWQRKKIS